MIGCSDSSLLTDTKYDSSINGNSITISRNQKFILELDVHADGGYQWFSSLSDSNAVWIDSTRFRPKGDKQLVGGLTVESFYFRTNKNGKCKVSLYERRAWEKEISPINKIYFDVLVR
jgi:predicted secreted protein